MVIAEFYTTISGLGYMITRYAHIFEADKAFVPVILLMFLGITLTAALKWVERRIAPGSGRPMSTAALSTAAAAQPAGAAARIRARGLIKRFGTLEVFRGIDFDLGEREIVTIVGPRRPAARTSCRCIDGLIPLDAGEIWCGSPRVTESSWHLTSFQHLGPLPWKTVAPLRPENVRDARHSCRNACRISSSWLA